MAENSFTPSGKRPRGRPRKRQDRTGIAEFDGTLSWWKRMLGLLARELVITRDSDIRQDLKAIAAASLAAKHLEDVAEIEERVKQIEERDAAIAAQRRNGIARVIGPSTPPGAAKVA